MIFANVKKLTIPEGNVIKITSKGTVIWQKGANAIPTEYQEVEWLRSTGANGPYIDLGFAFDTKGKVEIMCYSEFDTNAYLFGTAENSGAFRCMISCPYGGTRAYYYGSNGSTYIGLSQDIILGTFNEIEVMWEKENFYAINKTTGNNTSQHKSQVAYTLSTNLYLFGQMYNGTVRTGNGIRQVKRFKYYDKNDNLICSLVPCYRKSDGVMGMYDIARNIFLTKAGGNDWTKGADVN